MSVSRLRDVGRKTASMRRAARWLAELHANGTRDPDPWTLVLEHMTTCADCELRENNDPAFCEIADEIYDGPDDDEEVSGE